MEHELFRHLEMEAFVPETVLVDAAHFVESVRKHADENINGSGLFDAGKQTQNTVAGDEINDLILTAILWMG